MDTSQMWLLIGMFSGFMVIGLWMGWECWRNQVKYARYDVAIMDAGYRAALKGAVEALALWEQTRGGWCDDGTTTTPGLTAMKMAHALGYARTALLADHEPPNERANQETTR